MPEQPPSLHFVIDELLLEGHRDASGDVKRIHALQSQLWSHVSQSSEFGDHVERLLRSYDELVPDAQRAVAGALCELCLHTEDLALARRLGERIEHRSTIMGRVGPKTIPQSQQWMDLFMSWDEAGDVVVGEALCLCVGRMARWGSDVQQFVPWLLDKLSTEGVGRGSARIDVGRQAAAALASIANATDDSGVEDALRQRADGTKTVAANVEFALTVIERDR